MAIMRALVVGLAVAGAMILSGCSAPAPEAGVQAELRAVGRVGTVSLSQGGVAEFFASGVVPADAGQGAFGFLESREADQFRAALAEVEGSRGALCLTRSGVPSPSVPGEYLVSSWGTWREAVVHGQPIRCVAAQS